MLPVCSRSGDNRRHSKEGSMRQIGVAIVGTGWCGGIRAETCAAHTLTKSLHIAEIRPERLAEVAKATGAKTAVSDYRDLLKMGEIEAGNISRTPETTHYPIARDRLAARKHGFFGKPRGLVVTETNKITTAGRKNKLK